MKFGVSVVLYVALLIKLDAIFANQVNSRQHELDHSRSHQNEETKSFHSESKNPHLDNEPISLHGKEIKSHLTEKSSSFHGDKLKSPRDDETKLHKEDNTKSTHEETKSHNERKHGKDERAILGASNFIPVCSTLCSNTADWKFFLVQENILFIYSSKSSSLAIVDINKNAAVVFSKANQVFAFINVATGYGLSINPITGMGKPFRTQTSPCLAGTQGLISLQTSAIDAIVLQMESNIPKGVNDPYSVNIIKVLAYFYEPNMALSQDTSRFILTSVINNLGGQLSAIAQGLRLRRLYVNWYGAYNLVLGLMSALPAPLANSILSMLIRPQPSGTSLVDGSLLRSQLIGVTNLLSAFSNGQIINLWYGLDKEWIVQMNNQVVYYITSTGKYIFNFQVVGYVSLGGSLPGNVPGSDASRVILVDSLMIGGCSNVGGLDSNLNGLLGSVGLAGSSSGGSPGGSLGVGVGINLGTPGLLGGLLAPLGPTLQGVTGTLSSLINGLGQTVQGLGPTVGSLGQDLNGLLSGMGPTLNGVAGSLGLNGLTGSLGGLLGGSGLTGSLGGLLGGAGLTGNLGGPIGGAGLNGGSGFYGPTGGLTGSLASSALIGSGGSNGEVGGANILGGFGLNGLIGGLGLNGLTGGLNTLTGSIGLNGLSGNDGILGSAGGQFGFQTPDLIDGTLNTGTGEGLSVSGDALINGEGTLTRNKVSSNVEKSTKNEVNRRLNRNARINRKEKSKENTKLNRNSGTHENEKQYGNHRLNEIEKLNSGDLMSRNARINRKKRFNTNAKAGRNGKFHRKSLEISKS